jgi:hypothetical protein
MALQAMYQQTQSLTIMISLQLAYVAVAERSSQAYPTLMEWAGVGSIPANSDALNVPSFRRWRFEMKLSPFYGEPAASSTLVL